MEMQIGGKRIVAQPEQTLLDLICELGLQEESLSKRYLAAKLAGEVFNLNYIPVRAKETLSDRPSVRRAMAASNGVVHLLRYTDPAGCDVYMRTAQFVLFYALHKLWPVARAKMNYTVGKALYVEVFHPEFDAGALKQKVQEIVDADIPLIRRSMPTEGAIDYFRKNGQQDKAKLLAWRGAQQFYMYAYEDFADYYYGELAPSTGCLRVWNIIPAEGGFMFLYPEDSAPDRAAEYVDLPKLLSVSKEGQRWCELMKCEDVADLNELTLRFGS